MARLERCGEWREWSIGTDDVRGSCEVHEQGGGKVTNRTDSDSVFHFLSIPLFVLVMCCSEVLLLAERAMYLL